MNNTVKVPLEEAEDYLYSIEDALFVTVCLPIVAGIGILTNTAFLFTLFRIQAMRTMTNFYLGNLAFSDVGFLIMMLTRHTWTYYELAPIEQGIAWPSLFGCTVPRVVTYCLHYSSVFLVSLVTLERYFAICYPLKHRTFLDGTKRAVKLVAVSWALSLCLSLFEFSPATVVVECYDFPDDYNVDDIVVVHRCKIICEWCWNGTDFIDTTQFFLSFIASLFMYLQIVKKLSKRTVGRTVSETIARRNVQARNSVARMLAVNSAIFFVCLFPMNLTNICWIVLSYGGPSLFSSEVLISLQWVARILGLINSAINPVIYTITNPRYRRAFIEAFGLRSEKD